MPYPRPAEAGAVELSTVFETLDPPPAPPWDTTPITDTSMLESGGAKIHQEAAG